MAVHALPGLDAAPLSEALAGAGVALAPASDETSAVRVVLTGSYLDPGLDAINRQALTRGFAWMTVKATGSTPWIGSLFRPDDGPCWQCLAHRMRGNRPVAG